MKIEEGMLIFAKESLAGDYFEDALILVVVCNEDGPFGLILNRPVTMPISEVFHPVPETPVERRRFYMGGPVDEESLHVITIVDNPSGGYAFSDGLELGGEISSIEELIERSDSSAKLFLGYCGWSPGQLESEIEEGSWSVHKVISVRKLFQRLSEEGVPLFREKIVKILSGEKKS